MIILRILFGIAAMFIFMFVGILFANLISYKTETHSKEQVKGLALIINTIFLAVTLVLLCVEKGII